MLTRKPRKGERIRWPHWTEGKVATVQSVEGNLCYIAAPGRPVEPFIWNFHDGINTLVINLDERGK